MDLHEIDSCCDNFEARLKQGDEISIDEFLSQAQLQPDPHLLSELRRVERDYRTAQADTNVFAEPATARLDVEMEIGPYHLLQTLGEGGMGCVYLAEQHVPVTRRVALKLIKPGMDSREIINRFEAERQALARMDHPHIARVLDAGATPKGRPYFVMELVEGLSITRYCDRAQLGLRARLELFIAVCQAIQHAHQRAIIHRDIKPSNILVATVDDRPLPKVIDFGLAKVLEPTITRETMVTQFGQLIGTLNYMSPEQASWRHQDIDIRTDVYSLGVLLYEMLTGCALFSDEQQQASIDEVLRITREVDPQKPSSRLAAHENLSQLALKRGSEARKLVNAVRGDLDCIVMKALEKERDRRYQSCTSLMEDIERYLSDQPVLASAPSQFYLMTKFVRRNAVLVGVAATIFVSMAVATAGTSWGLYHSNLAREANGRKIVVERQAKEVAIAAQKEAEQMKAETEAALARESRQLAYAEAITQFVRDDFLALTSVQGQIRFGDSATLPLGKNATLQQLLDRAAEKLDQRSDLEPRTVAALRFMIGANYRGMGLFDLARQHLEQSAEIFKEALGPEDEQTFNALNELAITELKSGNVDKAISMLQAILSSKEKLGQEYDARALAIKNNLAAALQENEILPLATQLYEEVYCIRSESLPEDDQDRIQSLNNLAECYRRSGRNQEALPLHLQAYELRRAFLPEQDLRILQSMVNLGICYHTDGQLDKAMPLYEKSQELMHSILEEGHPDVLAVEDDLANGYQMIGKPERALEILQQVYETRKRVFGENERTTLRSLSNLAESHRLLGNFQLARELHEQALAGRRKVLPPNHLDILYSLNNLAICYQIDEQYGRAVEMYNECRQFISALTPDRRFPPLLAVSNNLAHCQTKLGRYVEAIEMLAEIVEIRQKDIPDHPFTFSSMHNLAECYILNGDLNAGLPLLKQALAARQEKLSADHPETVESLALLAKTESEHGDFDSGLSLFREAADKVELNSTLWPIRDELRGTLAKMDRQEELKTQLEADQRIARELLKSDPPTLAQALATIAEDWLALGNYQQALPLVDECIVIHGHQPLNQNQASRIRSIKASVLIDQVLAGEIGERQASLRKAELWLEASYRVQAERAKTEATLDLLEQLRFTLAHLTRVTKLQENSEKYSQWQAKERTVIESSNNFGKTVEPPVVPSSVEKATE